MLRCLLITGLGLFGAGCVRVRPYQREYLSERVMAPGGLVYDVKSALPRNVVDDRL